MKIGVIGGGVAGLTTAYLLSLKGHEVVVFEKEKELGGLAAGFFQPGWGWSIEKYIHHFFWSDSDLVWLLARLGIKDKLFWRRPRTDTLIKEEGNKFASYQLDTPLSLLLFPGFSFVEKIRLGLLVLELKLKSNIKRFEGATAYSYLRKKLGKRVFEVVWKPLLVGKFGKEAKNISMAWFWARIKKRSKRLGYLEGGLVTLVDKLVEEILKRKGQILVNSEVVVIEGLRQAQSRLGDESAGFGVANLIRKIREGVASEKKVAVDPDEEKVVKVKTCDGEFFFDRVVVTCATPIFLKMAKGLGDVYRERVGKLKYLAACSLIIVAKKTLLTDAYWLNIAQSNFPFLLVGQQTNFIDFNYYGRSHIFYVGNYYDHNHPNLKKPGKKLFSDFWPKLSKINPEFKKEDVVKIYKFIDRYGQMVVDKDYRKNKPEMKTPIIGVYLANMDLTYPFDRGINYAVGAAREVVKKIEWQ